MTDLEPKLGLDYIRSLFYSDRNPMTFPNTYLHMLNVLRPFVAQEADKTQDVSDNIIKNYFN